jgi:hypothetical protein
MDMLFPHGSNSSAIHRYVNNKLIYEYSIIQIFMACSHFLLRAILKTSYSNQICANHHCHAIQTTTLSCMSQNAQRNSSKVAMLRLNLCKQYNHTLHTEHINGLGQITPKIHTI